MSHYDISVIVTAHSETVVSGPAMHSAERAIRVAETRGFHIERLIGLDKSSEDCLVYFTQPMFSNWKIFEFQFGDPYPTRNAMVEIATGKWIAFLDADDLFSENWIAEAGLILTEAEKTNDNIIVHPELNWVFDGSDFVFSKPDQSDLIFMPDYYYFSNYYDMLCMAPNEIHRKIPYVNRDLVNGFGYADMQWSIETMAAGWRHCAAKNTIIFKRRRDQSVVIENNSRRTVIFDIDPLAIDHMANLRRSAMRRQDD